MDPHHGRHESQFDEEGDVHDLPTSSQFPSRWQPIAGGYRRADYSRRGRFNERDFASVAATTAAMQPFILGIEAYANAIMPDLYGSAAGFGSAAFVGRWLTQTVAVAALKAFGCFLRNYGDSLLRDLAVWLWINAIRASWYTFGDYFLSWLPWWRRDTGPWRPIPTPAPPRVPWWRRWSNKNWRWRWRDD